jgi:hypothetical protein
MKSRAFWTLSLSLLALSALGAGSPSETRADKLARLQRLFRDAGRPSAASPIAGTWLCEETYGLQVDGQFLDERDPVAFPGSFLLLLQARDGKLVPTIPSTQEAAGPEAVAYEVTPSGLVLGGEDADATFTSVVRVDGDRLIQETSQKTSDPRVSSPLAPVYGNELGTSDLDVSQSSRGDRKLRSYQLCSRAED